MARGDLRGGAGVVGSSNATTLGGVTPTAAGLALLDDADAAAQRATLGAQRALTPTSAVKTSAYTAVAGEIVCYDASGGTFQINAPASPSNGDVFAVWETAGSTTAVTVSGNGANINRAASVSVSAADAYVTFQYSSARSRWMVM